MKKEKIIFAITIIFFILTLSLSGASVKLLQENLVKNYIGGEKIKGFLNLSLENENADSILKSNYNNSGITLLDFLLKNGFSEGVQFNCSSSSCQNNYESKSEVSTLTFEGEDENYIGFKLNGKDVEVTSISFKVDSDSPPSCSAEFSVDILGNESLRLQGNSYNDVSCGPRIKGCFDQTLDDYDTAVVNTVPYCQRIELPSAPAFRIGAKVENSSAGGKLTMRMFDDEWNVIGNCQLPKHSQINEELSCIVNHTVVRAEPYYICIETDKNSNDFEIESEIDGDVCGNSDIDFIEYERDYNIFAQALQYNPDNIIIDNNAVSKLTEQTLADYANYYLDKIYGNDCSEGCVIPFKINAKTAQIISVLQPDLRYESNGAILTNNRLYLLEEEKAKISSKNIRANIENADLYIPLSPTSKELQLYIGNDELFSKKIKINVTSGFSFDISPKIVQFAIETTFFIITDQNITHSKWSFGNGDERESNKGFISYTYLKDGKYNLTVEATNSKNAKSIQSFGVTVGNVSQSLDKLINQSKAKIASLEKSINSLEPWIKEEILIIENLTLYKETISKIEKSIDEKNNESDIYTYASQLNSFDIPRSINYTSLGRLPMEVGLASVDSFYIIELESECTDGESECKNYDWVDGEKVNDYLIYWNPENFDSEVSYKTLTRFAQDENEDLFTHFVLEMSSKKEFSGEKYLIIPYPMNSVKFKENYGALQITGEHDGIAIPLSGDRNIELLVNGKISPVELGAFVSPSIEFIIEELKIEPSCKDNPELPECEKRSGLWLYLLLALGILASYIVLQEWYKRRYQSYLFPNTDDLYNVINYIHNSRLSGMNDGQIRKGLADMKWKQEQINFALKKIDGKRTGMWEIPIFKFFENRKIKKEIEKRNEENQKNAANGGSARFFNRPN